MTPVKLFQRLSRLLLESIIKFWLNAGKLKTQTVQLDYLGELRRVPTVHWIVSRARKCLKFRLVNLQIVKLKILKIRKIKNRLKLPETASKACDCEFSWINNSASTVWHLSFRKISFFFCTLLSEPLWSVLSFPKVFESKSSWFSRQAHRVLNQSFGRQRWIRSPQRTLGACHRWCGLRLPSGKRPVERVSRPHALSSSAQTLNWRPAASNVRRQPDGRPIHSLNIAIFNAELLASLSS